MKRCSLYCAAALLIALVWAGCSTDRGPVAPNATGVAAKPAGDATASASEETGAISPVLSAMNGQLEATGLQVRLHRAEWIVLPGSEVTEGQTVFANDRTFQLGTRWVPGDARRNAAGDALTYLVDRSDGKATGGLRNAQTEPAIDRAMTTWDVTTTCSNLPIVKVADTGKDPDIVDFLLGFGRLGDPFLADITHAGWLPKGFFDALAPGGGDFILGVTFTFVFVDGAGNATDVNQDGFLDTALKETYYNNNFPWGINTNFPIDVESVALHESGHALEQGHFGKIFRTDANGEIHFAPRAVMNAAYSGIQQSLTGDDEAGHCTLFGSWPN